MEKVNVKSESIKVVKNHYNNVAMEYYRGTSKSRYLAFSPEGLCEFEASTAKFEGDFNRPCTDGHTPWQSLLAMVRSVKSAYVLDAAAAGVLLILCERAAFGEGGIAKADAASLHTYHNEIAAVAGGKLAGKFKSKADGRARVEELHGYILEPTDKQRKNAQDSSARAAQRLAGLGSMKALVADTMRSNGSARATGKAAAVPIVKTKERGKTKTKGAGTGTPRGLGIGSFCSDLLRAGKSNEEVLTAVQKKFPQASTKMASVTWYRNKLIHTGE